MKWPIYAAISAIFAGMTALLAKIGVSQIPSNLATLIRTVVIIVFATGIVLSRGEFRDLGTLTGREWTALSTISRGMPPLARRPEPIP